MFTFVEPKVELLKQPETVEEAYKFLELCGRTCYKSEDRITATSAKTFVDSLIKRGHLSVCEHLTTSTYHCNFRSVWETNRPDATEEKSNIEVLIEEILKHNRANTQSSYTFRITCSRACSHQIVRHRKFSYSQESMRYCNYKNGLNIIKPVWYDAPETLERTKKLYNQYVSRVSLIYYDMVNFDGLKPEDARGILPHDTKTEIVVTIPNIELFRKFLDLRTDPHTQTEFRNIALEMKRLAGI